MRAAKPFWRCLVLRVLGGLLLGLPVARADAPDIGVAVLHSSPWSPADTVRDGAGEFEVLLFVARLQHEHSLAGLVSVGDRNGIRQSGGEFALRRTALAGVPVAKIALRGEIAADPDGIFLDAGRLTEEQASRVLRHCLEVFGAPPAAANPDQPTKKELAAIRTHLRRYQAAFTHEDNSLVAVK